SFLICHLSFVICHSTTGSWFQCTATRPRGLSMNRGSPRQVLECASLLSSLPKKTPAGHALSILSICLIFSVSTVADARLVYPQSPQPGSLPACWAVLDV